MHMLRIMQRIHQCQIRAPRMPHNDRTLDTIVLPDDFEVFKTGLEPRYGGMTSRCGYIHQMLKTDHLRWWR